MLRPPPKEKRIVEIQTQSINQSYSYPDGRNRPSTTPFSFSSLSFQFLTYHSQGKHRARIHSFVSQEEGLKRLSLDVYIYISYDSRGRAMELYSFLFFSFLFL